MAQREQGVGWGKTAQRREGAGCSTLPDPAVRQEDRMDSNALHDRHMALMRQVLTRTNMADGAIKPFDTSGEIKAQHDPYKRERGKDWPLNAETMIGMKRLSNVHELVESVDARSVEGAFVECGIWRGGVLMYATEFFNCRPYNGSVRPVFGFDSFEGLPEGGHYEEDEGDPHHTMNQVFAVSEDEVWNNFRRYGIDTARVRLYKGWFRDSLPAYLRDEGGESQSIAILRIDGDMYEGTIDPLKYLYPKVSIGGYVIVDDYGDVSACRKAVHDYLDSIGEQPDIIEIDHTGIYWRKP